jgi:putative ABC transport system permease protein
MKNNSPIPPKLAERLLTWFLKEELAEEVLGDLEEKFYEEIGHRSAWQAKLNYWYQVLNYLRPFAIKNYKSNSNTLSMFNNYFKISYRNLIHNKGFSFINIMGLSIGMAVAILIGLWIHNELSYNKYHRSYDRVAQVYQNQTFENGIQTWPSQAMQLAPALRNEYSGVFSKVVTSTFNSSSAFGNGEKTLYKRGVFIEAPGPEIFSATMVHGSLDALNDQRNILISESFAEAFFGQESAVGQMIRLANEEELNIAGVYKDFPSNSEFDGTDYMASWEFYAKLRNLEERVGWGNSWFRVFVELEEGTSLASASTAIKDVKLNHTFEDDKRFKPQLFLHPMSKWHLYREFSNGVNSGGAITYVWMFGIIGVFILILACINFMNLSTARSEKRAKEVGIRKSLGSLRNQLVLQFYSESLLVSGLAFVISLLIILTALPYFSGIVNAELYIPWVSWQFWVANLSFILFTSLLAGSYPALLLSSFSPIKSLKKSAMSGGMLRRALVVLQFSISITLIIGTMVINKQIQHAQNRPLGYDTKGLITLTTQTQEIEDNFELLKNTLIDHNLATAVSLSESEVTDSWTTNSGWDWQGKDPNVQDEFVTVAVDHDFGKVVNWEIVKGRDFDRNRASDSLTMIINETAVNYLGFEDPIGQKIKAFGQEIEIIGVVKDIMNQSPFDPIRQTVYYFDFIGRSTIINIKMNPELNVSRALEETENVFLSINPDSQFNYQFADDDLKRKYRSEERTRTFAVISSLLTIIISALGIFGMATYIAEQKSKEISIRKILGATVSNIWMLLSKDFAILILISGVIATPLAYFLAENWLEDYVYRTELSWWIFALALIIALLISLLTISYQTIKAALINPIKSLKSE